MQIQGNPKFDTGLLTAAAAFGGVKAVAAVNVASRILNSLSDQVARMREHGGRAAFPAVVRWNVLQIAECVEGAEDAPQTGWRWCRNCQGLFYAAAGTLGVCAAGGPHTREGSAEYGVSMEGQDPGQEGWRWCRNCQGFFYAGGPSMGACPAGGPHTQDGSGQYRVQYTWQEGCGRRFRIEASIVGAGP